MRKLPFARLPPAPFPGSSYFISNAVIIAKRVALNLEDPVRIHAGEWQEDHPVVHWYRRHRDSKIQCMQLRKEQKAPFFQEYITFRLDNGRCFRLDRRQLLDKRSPMDCAEAKGVEAYDTIEQITSLEDSIYNPSDSLVQLDFGEGIFLGIFLMVLLPISRHSRARAYTIQRYNCYFYAQTVLLCTLCANSGWDKEYLWKGEEWNADGAETLIGQMPLIELEKNPGTNIKLLVNQPEIEIPPMQTSGLTNPNQGLTPPTERTTVWGTALRFMQNKRKDSHSGAMQESTIGELQSYIWRMIHAHSIRVEQYKILLRCSARDVERDIKTAMNEVWHQAVSSCYIFHPQFITPQATLHPDTLVRIQFDEDMKPNRQLLAWYRSQRNPWVTSMQLRKERSPTFLHEYVAFNLRNGSCFRIDRRQSADEQSPVDRVEDKNTEAYDTIEPITHLEDSKYNPSDCLIQLDFQEGVSLEMFFTILREISRHRQANGYTSNRYNSHFYARTVLLCALCFMYGWDQEHLWGADNRCLDKTEPPNSQATLFEMTKQPRIGIKILDKQLDKPRDSQSGVMRESTIGDLQAYLWGMIHAHSVRVEQYKFLFGWSAEDIERDIKTAMNEVWHQVMPAFYIWYSNLKTHQVTPDPDKRVRIQFDGNGEPSHPLSDWYACHRTKKITTMQLRKEQNSPFSREYVAFKLNHRLCFRVDRRYIPVQQGVEAYDAIERIEYLEDSMYYASHCLIQLDFGVGVPLKFLLDIFRAIAPHRWESAYTHGLFNCCFYVQSVIHCACALRVYRRWGEGQLWRTDYLSENDLHWTVEVQGYLVKIRIMHERPAPKVHSRPDGHGSDDVGSSARDELKGTRPSASHVLKMKKSTYIEVKRYLSDLIREHGARVEKYEFLLNSTGRNVEQDIKTAMNEIWLQLDPKYLLKW